MPAWGTPKFAYSEKVTIRPLDNMLGRVVDLKWIGADGVVEYVVRYVYEGKEHTIRVFEDELEATNAAE